MNYYLCYFIIKYITHFCIPRILVFFTTRTRIERSCCCYIILVALQFISHAVFVAKCFVVLFILRKLLHGSSDKTKRFISARRIK